MCRLLKRFADIGAVRCSLAALLFVLSTAAVAQASEKASAANPLETFQQREDLLFQVGYRLATGNASFCEESGPVAGFLIHDAAAYGQPDAVRETFGLKGDIGVQSVAPGSPADAAGLRQNDTLVSIEREMISERWAPTRPGWKRSEAIREKISAVLAVGHMALSWTRTNAPGFEAEIKPVLACTSQFELINSSDNASADGQRVLVGESFPGFSYPEEEFAAAVAHELAHNILGHIRLFESTGRKRSLVRLSERDADRLMPWLLANAGYDPAAAVRFMERWGPKHGGWIFRKRTHDGWDERVEFIKGELPIIRAIIADSADRRADWSTHFRTELEGADLED